MVNQDYKKILDLGRNEYDDCFSGCVGDALVCWKKNKSVLLIDGYIKIYELQALIDYINRRKDDSN
jgi:hypothetical protein